MSWVVVRGVYKEGKIEPLDRAVYQEGVEVLVLFPEHTRRTEAKGIWRQMKQEMTKEIPDLLSMTVDEKREEFDRLSNAIAERMPHRSVEEFERAMRGDEYGLVGY